MIFPPPIDALVLGQDKEFNAAWKKWFNQVFFSIFAVQNYAKYFYTLSPSYPLQFPANTEILQIDAAGVIAAATIALPAYPVDGQRIYIASTQTITALTLTSAYTIKNAPTAGVAGVCIAYYFSKTNLTWYRLA